MLHVVLLQVLLITLGLMSTAWNLIAFVLYPLLSREKGTAVGRAGIAYGYRWFWSVARLSGMLHMDARSAGRAARRARPHRRGQPPPACSTR